MSFSIEVHNLAGIYNYADAAKFYESTEAIRGQDKEREGVPLKDNRRDWSHFKLTRELDADRQPCYNAWLYGTAVVTWFVDGTVKVDVSYDSQSTRKFADYYTGRHGIRIASEGGLTTVQIPLRRMSADWQMRYLKDNGLLEVAQDNTLDHTHIINSHRASFYVTHTFEFSTKDESYYHGVMGGTRSMVTNHKEARRVQGLYKDTLVEVFAMAKVVGGQARSIWFDKAYPYRGGWDEFINNHFVYVTDAYQMDDREELVLLAAAALTMFTTESTFKSTLYNKAYELFSDVNNPVRTNVALPFGTVARGATPVEIV
jgi:hypothetical protein